MSFDALFISLLKRIMILVFCFGGTGKTGNRDSFLYSSHFSFLLKAHLAAPPHSMGDHGRNLQLVRLCTLLNFGSRGKREGQSHSCVEIFPVYGAICRALISVNQQISPFDENGDQFKKKIQRITLREELLLMGFLIYLFHRFYSIKSANDGCHGGFNLRFGQEWRIS
jgi:hypothetical protein